MKMNDALKIIATQDRGYMVSCEHIEGCMLVSDHFPDKHAGEPLRPTEEEAWELARAFAHNTFGQYVNIYVVDNHFMPVPGYLVKKIINR